MKIEKGGEGKRGGEKKVVENSLLLLSNLSCFQKSFAGKRKKGKRREERGVGENLFRQFWVQRRRGKGVEAATAAQNSALLSDARTVCQIVGKYFFLKKILF